VKVAVLVPTHRDPTLGFTASLVAMVAEAGKRPEIELKAFWSRGAMVHVARNHLIAWALEWGADYGLFIDSDQTFPADALFRLLDRKLPVIGASSVWRTEPHYPTASNVGRDGRAVPVWTTEAKAKAGEIEAVDQLGCAFLLIDLRAVIPALKSHAKAQGKDLWPLFDFRWKGGNVIGEDHYFCARLRTAGISIHVDHELSWNVGHVAERVLHPSDGITREDANAGSILPATGTE
jgi:hypothetical protein